MHIIENERYQGILKKLYKDFPGWEQFNGKTFFLSGATGMIGSFFMDAIMLRNQALPPEKRCRIIAAGRSRQAAKARFPQWMDKPELCFVEQDISNPLEELPWQPDFWIHGASTSHPLEYSTQPVNTILANVLGTRNILEAAARNQRGRVLLLSSVEIYGENRGDTEYFAEEYCGFLNCNTLRAGYPEAKRVSEALCQAYLAQHGVDAVTIRFPRCYGPTMKSSDTKAVAQFLQNGVRGENIVLKSKGAQLYSFAHVSDAVLGMLWVLLRGETGQAYNLGDAQSDVMQKDLAKMIADYAGTQVVFDLPSEVERRGYSTASKALMDGSKLKALGWRPRYELTAGIRETIDILKRGCST
ncbi:MAG: NAD-dependent epimerase/dehydratase family protein [Lawsonibacter sp.]|nr:NAD-dependent epimerase/dehydratase family protein [Lawsonibacter sp.]